MAAKEKWLAALLRTDTKLTVIDKINTRVHLQLLSIAFFSASFDIDRDTL